jgi:hypothetical protein
MGTEIDAKRSPMEQFQDNLKKQLRDDIARMLPEEAVQEMIATVVRAEFFAVRFVDDPTDISYGRKRQIKQGTVFQDIVLEAARPILEKLAKEWVDKNVELIAEHWRKVTDAGLMKYVATLHEQMATKALRDQMNLWLQNMNNERSNKGLPPINVPMF